MPVLKQDPSLPNCFRLSFVGFCGFLRRFRARFIGLIQYKTIDTIRPSTASNG